MFLPAGPDFKQFPTQTTATPATDLQLPQPGCKLYWSKISGEGFPSRAEMVGGQRALGDDGDKGTLAVTGVKGLS